MKKIIYFYPTLLSLYSALPLAVGAQTPLDKTLRNIGSTLQTIIGLLFVIATITFLWGVIQFIAKSGDEKARDAAKGIMTWGIIGLAVMAAAWGITRVLTTYFGIQRGVAPEVPSFPIP